MLRKVINLNEIIKRLEFFLLHDKNNTNYFKCTLVLIFCTKSYFKTWHFKSRDPIHRTLTYGWLVLNFLLDVYIQFIYMLRQHWYFVSYADISLLFSAFVMWVSVVSLGKFQWLPDLGINLLNNVFGLYYVYIAVCKYIWKLQTITKKFAKLNF